MTAEIKSFLKEKLCTVLWVLLIFMIVRIGLEMWYKPSSKWFLLTSHLNVELLNYFFGLQLGKWRWENPGLEFDKKMFCISVHLTGLLCTKWQLWRCDSSKRWREGGNNRILWEKSQRRWRSWLERILEVLFWTDLILSHHRRSIVGIWWTCLEREI